MKNQNIIIASNGKTTCVMVDGKVYGDHIVKVEFVHDNKDKPNDVRLLLTTDCVPLEGDASDEERQGFMKRIEELSKEQKGERIVEKVDELIEALAEHISYVIASGKGCGDEISDETRALAELIAARAKFPVTDAEIKTDLKSTEKPADAINLPYIKPVAPGVFSTKENQSEIHIKVGETEITCEKGVISVSAPKISLDSSTVERKLGPIITAE